MNIEKYDRGRYKKPWQTLPTRYWTMSERAYSLVMATAPAYAAVGTFIPWAMKQGLKTPSATDGANLYLSEEFLEEIREETAKNPWEHAENGEQAEWYENRPYSVLARVLLHELIHIGNKHNQRRDEYKDVGGSVDKFQVAADLWADVAAQSLMGSHFFAMNPSPHLSGAAKHADYHSSAESIAWRLPDLPDPEKQNPSWYSENEESEGDGGNKGKGSSGAGEGSQGSNEPKKGSEPGGKEKTPQKGSKYDPWDSWWKKREPEPQRIQGDLQPTSDKAEYIPTVAEVSEGAGDEDGCSHPGGPLPGTGEGYRVKWASLGRYRRRHRKQMLSTKAVRGILGQMLPAYTRMQTHGMANGLVLPRLQPRGARVAIVLDLSGSMSQYPGMMVAYDLVRAMGYGDEVIGVTHNHELVDTCTTPARLPAFFKDSFICGGTAVQGVVDYLHAQAVDSVVWVTDCYFGDCHNLRPRFRTIFVCPEGRSFWDSLEWEGSKMETYKG